MKILKRVYKKPTLWESLCQLFSGKKPKHDHYPYIVNVGYHNDVINLITCSPTPSDVTVNGQSVDMATIAGLIEKLKTQFKHKNCDYTLEDA